MRTPEIKEKVRYIVVQVLGVMFLILGLAGLALPFLQGFLFLIIGTLLISIYNPPIHRRLHRYLHKHRKLHAYVEKVEKWIKKIFGEPPPENGIPRDTMPPNSV